jgi:integrase
MPVRMLTDPFIKNEKPQAERVEYADQKIGGLYLIVQPSGHKSWAVRYRMGRHSRKYTLGPYPRLGLAAARTAAGRALEAVELGSDPAIARRNDDNDDGSVGFQIESYRQRHAGRARPATHMYVTRVLDQAAAAWAGRPLRSIVKRDIVKLMDEAADRGPAAEITTHKVLRAFFHWVEGREENYESPMRTIPAPGKDTIRQRTLDDSEIVAVWRNADSAGGGVGALVKLLLLTGCRRSEITKLERSEIKANSIELDGKRTKNGEPLSVPLTDAMRAVLAKLPKTGRFVLNGADAPMTGQRNNFRELINPDIPHWRLHDLRRSVASGMARLQIPVPVIEKCLNHKSGSFGGIVATYQTYDFRKEVREAYEKWNAHIKEITSTRLLSE